MATTEPRPAQTAPPTAQPRDAEALSHAGGGQARGGHQGREAARGFGVCVAALLVREFLAAMMMTVVLTVTSLAINAPLRDHSNPNLTPNPAKAPWYFLGLQEILHYFPPTVAGVLIPGFVLVGLALLPYVDRNPSRAFEDRKLSIAVFTIFAVFFAIVTLAGSFFRGSGWQWIWPWQGVFFDL